MCDIMRICVIAIAIVLALVYTQYTNRRETLPVSLCDGAYDIAVTWMIHSMEEFSSHQYTYVKLNTLMLGRLQVPDARVEWVMHWDLGAWVDLGYIACGVVALGMSTVEWGNCQSIFGMMCVRVWRVTISSTRVSFHVNLFGPHITRQGRAIIIPSPNHLTISLCKPTL